MGGSASLCAADVAVVMGRNSLENAVWGYPARASVTARYVLLLKHIIQVADELLAHWREIIGLVIDIAKLVLEIKASQVKNPLFWVRITSTISWPGKAAY